MMKLDNRQQAMLKEIGIRLPWPTPARPIAAQPQQESISKGAGQQVSHHNPHSNTTQTTAAAHIQAIRAQASQLKDPQKTSVKNTRLNEKSERAAPSQASQTSQTPQKIALEPVQASTSTSTTLTPAEIEARTQHISQMGWDELELAVNQCKACSLCQSRTQTVFSAGVPTAQWMIIGEAPGEQEDKKGEPFVGAAGMLLDRMLQPLSLSRNPTEGQSPVYISNVLKCRPPRNRNPEPNEMALCQAFLKRQIELVQPKVILIVGRFAVQALLETTEAIGRLRGTVHQYKNTPAVVTYHPAYLLRNPIDKRKAWEDLCLAASILKEDNDA